MTALPTVPLPLLGLVPFLFPIPTLGHTLHQPTNCGGRDPNSEQFRELLELSAYQLHKLSVPTQLTWQLYKDSLKSVLNSGKETHYKSCLEWMETPNTHFSQHALCPWTYECDHDPTHFPAYILHAHCSSKLEEVMYYNSAGQHKCQCFPLTYPLKVLRLVGCSPDTGLEQWELTEQTVNVGCRCAAT